MKRYDGRGMIRVGSGGDEVMSRDLKGMRFGRLTAMEVVGKKNHYRAWRCLCECGNEIVIKSASLITGNTKSCGCLQREMRVIANTEHGFCGTRLYRIWKGMVARCKYPSSTSYKWYGARGITVCDEWTKFDRFKDWALFHGYSETLSIDRIDNEKGYSPDNCRWVTPTEQTMNRRCMRRDR